MEVILDLGMTLESHSVLQNQHYDRIQVLSKVRLPNQWSLVGHWSLRKASNRKCHFDYFCDLSGRFKIKAS
jgi:hypothetical protein